MSGAIFRLALVRTVVVLLQLCGLMVAADLPGVWIDVPFVKQEKDGCGAASIAMVMQYWQRQEQQPARPDSDPAQIQRELYSAKAHGIYASDMERYFKEKGFRTFTIRGEWEDLKQHLDKGRPLIVALKPAALKPPHERDARVYIGDGTPLHYVVVAGMDPGQGLVLVNDPAQRKLLKQDRASFERDWNAAGNWTLLALPQPADR
jgi:predicted double-glycine peptidase